MTMRPHVRAKVEKNCEYHEALAAQYEQLMHQSAAGNGSKKEQAGDPKLKRLFELHTEVAKQLREVLSTAATSAIEDALAARTVRRSETGMIPQPTFAHPPRRAPARSRMH